MARLLFCSHSFFFFFADNPIFTRAYQMFPISHSVQPDGFRIPFPIVYHQLLIISLMCKGPVRGERAAQGNCLHVPKHLHTCPCVILQHVPAFSAQSPQSLVGEQLPLRDVLNTR